MEPNRESRAIVWGKRALVGGAFTVILAACGSDTPNTSAENTTDVSEEPRPAVITDMQVDMTESVSFFILTGVYGPIKYDVEVKECGREGDKHAGEDGCVTDIYEVPKSYYDEHSEGDQIQLPIKDADFKG